MRMLPAFFNGGSYAEPSEIVFEILYNHNACQMLILQAFIL